MVPCQRNTLFPSSQVQSRNVGYGMAPHAIFHYFPPVLTISGCHHSFRAPIDPSQQHNTATEGGDGYAEERKPWISDNISIVKYCPHLGQMICMISSYFLMI